MDKVVIIDGKKTQLSIVGNITDEDRHTARFMLKKGQYVRVTGPEGKDSDELDNLFEKWFAEEYGDRGDVVQDVSTGKRYCHLRWDMSWQL